MLIDKVRINIKAGKGGDGGIDFEKSGKPAGGNGGDGGSVYLQGDHNVYDLSKFVEDKKLLADNGEQGGKNKKQGRDGEDLILKVPLVTRLYDLEGQELACVQDHDQKVLVSKGTRGGLGNHYFRRGQVATLRKTTKGKPGDEILGFLELKLKVDIILIGLPNAGKSTLINSLTNTSAKVAAYPFTTLEPNLGKLDELLLMDLPGFIEDTSEGKGLGTRYMRHTQSAKLVLHLISLEEEDIVKSYKVIKAETLKMAPHLEDVREKIVLTKTDLLPQSEVKAKIKLMQKAAKEVNAISAYDYDVLEKLKEELQLKIKD